MPVEVETLLSELRTILDQVTEGRVNVDEVKEEWHVVDDLGLTSLDMLELAFEIETRWGVTIDMEAAKTMSTVGDVVRYIVIKANEPKPPEGESPAPLASNENGSASSGNGAPSSPVEKAPSVGDASP